MRITRRRAAITLPALAATAGLVLATSAVARADVPQPGTVYGIGGVNVRSGPGTNYRIVGSVPNRQPVSVYCYQLGTNINGNPYWDYVPTLGFGDNAFIADAFVYTGADINTQVPPCTGD